MKASTRGKRNRARGKAFELKVKSDLESKGWIVIRWDKNIEFGNLLQSNELSKKQLSDLKKLMEKNKETYFCGADVSTERIGKLIQSKPKFNPFTHSLMMNSSGFPDYICISQNISGNCLGWQVQLVECKSGDEKHKYLDFIEKEKAKWITENLHIPVIIANKIKVGRRIEIKYLEFQY